MREYGFIGVGNMAGAIIRGIIASGLVQPQDITGADLSARDIRLTANEVRFCALEGSELVRTGSPIPGQFSVYNALAALACAWATAWFFKSSIWALLRLAALEFTTAPTSSDND